MWLAVDISANGVELQRKYLRWRKHKVQLFFDRSEQHVDHTLPTNDPSIDPSDRIRNTGGNVHQPLFKRHVIRRPAARKLRPCTAIVWSVRQTRLTQVYRRTCRYTKYM